MVERFKRVSCFISTAVIAITPTSCAPPALQAPYLQFLRATQALADQGNLDDPAVVQRVLHTTLTSKILGQESRAACRDDAETPQYFNQKLMSYEGESDFWFQGQPEGQSVDVPNFLDRNPGRTGQPKMSYTVSTRVVCYPKSREPVSEVSATLTFQNVPGFACITEQQLEAGFPKAKRVLATDGAIPYHYTGRTTKDTGVELTFDYVFGQKCLLSARVDQDVRNSTDFRRAVKKIDACQAHARTQSKARDLVAQLNELGEKCGGYWDYLPGGSRL